MAQKKVVLIGGGHAHMLTLARLGEITSLGHKVTVIQPSEHHYYSGMGPGMLGGFYRPDDIRFATRKRVEQQGGQFINDKVIRIDPEKQLVFLAGSSDPLPYDVLSCNAGSQVDDGAIVPDNERIFSVKPIEKLDAARRKILELGREKKLTIAVLGGGPSALEIAGNAWGLGQRSSIEQPEVLVIAGKTFLSAAPEKVRSLARASLTRRGIQLHLGNYVESVQNNIITLKNGDTFSADIIFSAIGIHPSPLFTDSGLPTGPDGGLLVNSFLQCPQYSNIFGGGDCIYHEPQPLDKVGVYAVRQNEILFNNICATLENKPLSKFEPGGKYLLIYNLGDGTGIFCKWFLVFSGRLAFLIKDYIDRKFMQKFQP